MDTSRIQEIILKVNGNDAEKTINRIKSVIENARQEKEKLAKEDTSKWGDKEWKKWQQLNREIERGEKQLKKYGTNATYVKQVLDNLNGKSLNDLQASLKTMQRILDRGLVPRGSEEWKQLAEAVAKTKEQIAKVKGETKSFGEAMDETKKNISFLSSVSVLATNIGGAFNSMKGKMEEYVNKYAELQEHISGVIKYTGMGAEAAAELNEEFKKMDTRTSRAALNDLAADAGRLGISGKKDVLDFVQAADQINVALGADLGEGAIKNIGKLATLFGDDKKMGLKQAMLSTASAVNDLAQSSSASEGYIVEFTGRLAGAAAQAGMTQAQVMGLASVMDQAMINAEESSTALSKILIKMYKDPAAMARAAGISVKNFTDTLKKDANAALIEFAKGVQKMGGLESVAPMLADLKLQGAGVSKMLLTLANDTQKVTDTQAQAAAAFAEGTSVTKEFNAANSTAQAQLEKAKNALGGVYAEIGEKLYPAFLAGTNAAVAFMKAVSGFIGVISQLKLTIVALSATLAIATLRQKAFTQATVLGTRVMALQRMGFGRLGVSIGIMHKGLKAVFTSITAFVRANPLGLLITGVTLAIEALDFFKNKSKEAAEAMKEREEAELNISNAERKAGEETSKQIARVKSLTNMILDNTRAQKNRLWAINELRKIIPDYNGKLGDEKKLTEDTTTAVDNYIDALKRMARQKVISNMVGELDSQIVVNELSRDRRQTGVTTRRNRLKKFLDEEEGMKQYDADIKAGLSKADAQNRLHKTIFGTDEYTMKSTTHVLELIARYRELNSQLNEMQGLLDESNKTLGRLNQNREMLIKGAERMGIKREEIEQANAGLADIAAKTRKYTPEETDTEKKKREAAFARLEKEYGEAAKKIAAAYAAGLEDGTQTEEAYYRKMLAAAEGFKKKYVAAAGAAADEKAKAEKKANGIIDQINDEHRRSLLAREDANYKSQQEKLNFYLETNQISQKEYNGQDESLLLMHQQNRLAIIKEFKTKEQQVIDELHSQEDTNAKRTAQGLERIKALLKEVHAASEKRNDSSKTYGQRLAEIDKEEERSISLIKQNAAKLKEMGIDAASSIKEIKEHFEALREELSKKYEAKVEIKALSSGIDFGFTGFAAAIGKAISVTKKYYREKKKERDKDAKEEEKTDGKQLRRRKKNRDKDTADEKKENKKQRKNSTKEAEEKWDAAVGIAAAANDTIQSIGSATSTLFQANCALETAKIEQEYNARIAAAEGNAELQQQLEEEKNAKIAEVKAKYAEKEFRLNIAMAVAQTATNALTAFGTMAKHEPYPALAIAAASLATATGMVQVAAIKKQYEAQKAAGFYSGGYTGGTDYRKPAGIVHEGEYVVPHEALRNRAVAPFVELIENARRTGRIASITPEDVSRAVTAPQRTAAGARAAAASASRISDTSERTQRRMLEASRGSAVTREEANQMARTLKDLNEQMRRGIKSYVVLSGPQGLDSQMERYRRLTGK